MAKPKIGDQAPDFSLEGTDGTFSLAAHRGEQVVLLFYPSDDTTVCTRQFCSYRDAGEEMGELDAVVVGISPQGMKSKQAFKAKYGLTTPLLADKGAAVSKSYGMYSRALSAVKRGVVVIDADGKIAHSNENFLSLTFDDADDLKKALSEAA